MTSREWFLRAQEENFAIGAFNIDSFDIFKAVLLAARNKKSPVMVEFSPGEYKYFGLKNIVDMVINAREEYQIPILLNIDHGKSIEDCLAVVEHPGFDDVHFDGSDLDFDENIKVTKNIVEHAHKKGILVEGEIDKISGSSEVHDEDVDADELKNFYTNPKLAARFVEETKVDIFAAFFGNLHGTFPVEPKLDMGLLANLRDVLPNTFLSLHGGSGIPAAEVKEAIRLGKIVKVNINTELRVAYKDALEEKISEGKNQYKVYDLMPDVINAVASVVESQIDVLGSGDKAS